MVLATFENTALEFEPREREKGTIHLKKNPGLLGRDQGKRL
jgi:hypothetical protein